MPRFVIKERRAIWVEEFYAVEAENEDHAEEVYYTVGEYEYLGHSLGDSLSFVDSELAYVERRDDNPEIDHPADVDEPEVMRNAVCQEQILPTIKDGKAVCPNCEWEELVHAYDISVYGRLEVKDGKIVATTHEVGWEYGGDRFRVFCPECGWESMDDEIANQILIE